MSITTAIANLSWLASGLPASVRFRRALDYPAETQKRLLCDYLTRNADSEFGRAYGFAEIRNYQEFGRRIPLSDYEDLQPFIERIRAGESRVLTAEPATHLVPTSGSSGARKLIPFTASLQREFNRAIGPWITDLYGRQPSVAIGTAYWSISPAIQIDNSETSMVRVGFEDDSVYLGSFRNFFADAVMAVPPEIRLVSDLDQFRYLTLLCLLRRGDLSLISVWHPSFLSLLVDALPGYWGELLHDIESGCCRYAKLLSPAVLRSLKLCPMPRHAQRLRKANPLKPETIWPRLRVISCWGDGHASFAKAELERRFPSAFVQSKGLIATECFVTIPFADFYPLALTSHFFEFMDERGCILLAHELKEGGIYQIIVTTGGGLWRYRLQDQVQVTDFVQKAPSLHFLGRRANVSDRRGEKLSEHFVAQAIRAVTSNLPLLPRFAMLAPDEDFQGCYYTLYVEGDVPRETGERLEKLLCENIHYAWCRRLGQLQLPRTFKIENGGYETFIARQKLDRKRIGEIKPCALSQNADWSKHFRGRYVADR
jgi:hypothetical protein